MSQKDPFRIVDEALWDLILASDEIVSRVSLGDRIQRTDPDKAIGPRRKLAPADRPELDLVPVGGEHSLWASSSGALILARWELRVRSGKQPLDEDIYPIRWFLLKALAQSADDLGKTWVTNTVIEDEVIDEGGAGTGERWSLVFTIAVKMNFDRVLHLTLNEESEL